MKSIVIDSTFGYIGSEKDRIPDFTENEIKNSPMLFNCDSDHAWSMGGDITRAFMDRLPDTWKDVPLVIDSRVHMLMPGWYPCIPGWHHDDVPRTRKDGQPNYGEGQDRSEHIIALVNGDICPTLFAEGAASFNLPADGETGGVPLYSTWHHEVERLIKEEWLERQSAFSNRLIHFDDRTWHSGQRAIRGGWRFFIRASRYWDSEGKIIARRNVRTNELRRQVQVYLEDPNKGW